MVHHEFDNASKKDKSCITLERLLERIKIWNQKYKKQFERHIPQFKAIDG